VALVTELNYFENRDTGPLICLPRFPLSKSVVRPLSQDIFGGSKV
jgi:hypothetical protein